MSTVPLLTTVEVEWRTELTDAVRSVAWSAGGRVVAVDAMGAVLVDRPGQLTTPIGPDPIAAAWLGDGRVLVADAGIGVVTVGGGCDRLDRVPSCLAGSAAAAVAGSADELVVWWPDRPDTVIVASRCGRVRDLAPVTSTLWAVAGSDGVSVVDVTLDAADLVVPLAGALAIAAHRDVAAVAVSDVSGTLHLIPLGGEATGVELDGYPDRVRRFGWVAGEPTHLVAVADDELTWWRLDRRGGVADEPLTAIAHAHTITAFAVGASNTVMTGDAVGGVRVWSPHLPDHPVWAGELAAPVTAAAWSREGDGLLVGCADGTLVSYRVVTGSIA